MEPTELYNRLQLVVESSTLTLFPGPLIIEVDATDVMAVKLLLQLYDEMPEGTIVENMFDVLHAAYQWTAFWVSLIDSAEKEVMSKKQIASSSE